MTEFQDKKEDGAGDLSGSEFPGVILNTIVLENMMEFAATDRYLEVLDVLLDSPGRAGSAGIKAVIETLQSKKQINDPVPFAMVQNQDSRFCEADTDLGGDAHYLFRVQRAHGENRLVTAVALQFEGVSSISKVDIDSSFVELLHSKAEKLFPPWVRIDAKGSINISAHVLEDVGVFASSSLDSIHRSIALSFDGEIVKAKREGSEENPKKVGAIRGTKARLDERDSRSPKIKLFQKQSESGDTLVEISNRSASSVYVYLVDKEIL